MTDSWFRCAGFIVGRSPVLRDFDECVDEPINELNAAYDGRAWLAAATVSTVVWFVELTHEGLGVDGPVESPLPVAKARRTRAGEWWVTSNVPAAEMLSRTPEQRAEYWRAFLRQVTDGLQRKQRLADIMDFHRAGGENATNRQGARVFVDAALDPNEPADGDAPELLEVHIPLTLDGPISDAGAAMQWIDEIEEFIASLTGSVSTYAESEEIGDHYVFFLSSNDSSRLVVAATAIAGLPGVPSGAFAVVSVDPDGPAGDGFEIPLGVAGGRRTPRSDSGPRD